MTLMENLNKDRGRVKDGCGHRLFIWRRSASSPVRLHRDRQQLLCALSKGCVLFHINDKDEEREQEVAIIHSFV